MKNGQVARQIIARCRRAYSVFIVINLTFYLVASYHAPDSRDMNQFIVVVLFIVVTALMLLNLAEQLFTDDSSKPDSSQ